MSGQWSRGPVLVIDAQPSRLVSLNSGQRQSVDLACEAAVLTEEAGQAVTWYRYNDSRLDGVVPPAQWQSLFPNAQELERQALPGERLDGLLDRWAGGREQRSNCPLVLILRQGDPLAALAGLGGWENTLQQVELVGPYAEQLWGSAVASWLVARGFEKVPDQPLVWERDLLGRCLRAYDELTAERDGLQLRLTELEGRMALINQELEGMLASLESNDPTAAVEESTESLS